MEAGGAVARLSLAAFVSYCSYALCRTPLLPLFAEDLGAGPSMIGLVVGASTVTGIVCSVMVWFLSLVDEGWMLAACLVVYAAGVATTSAATSAFVTDITRRARYGAAHGVFGTIYDIGDALGPIGAGLLVAAAGYAPMFRMAAAPGIAMAVAFAPASRTSPRRRSVFQ